MNSVLDKEVEGRGEPFFWHTRPTFEQMALMAKNSQPVVNVYWQEPIVTENDLFPRSHPKTITRKRYTGPLLAPLETYRTEF